MLRSAPAGTSLPFAMSANCKRPPDLSPHLLGGDKAVETASGAEIDDPLARLQGAERERVTDTGKSLDRAVR
jgi:hypothetical protein